jgi:hypothetical protein
VIDLFGELTYDPLIKRLGEMVLMRPNACKSIAFCRLVGRDVTGTYAKCYPPVTQDLWSGVSGAQKTLAGRATEKPVQPRNVPPLFATGEGLRGVCGQRGAEKGNEGMNADLEFLDATMAKLTKYDDGCIAPLTVGEAKRLIELARQRSFISNAERRRYERSKLR